VAGGEIADARIRPRSAALFATLLDKPLRWQVGPTSGVRPEVAAEVMTDFAELLRAGNEWRASRNGNPSGCVTEMHPDFSDMESPRVWRLSCCA
jgi:hypothetical protein